MTMVAGRILQRRDTPKTFARPLLKIPSPKLSAAYEDPFDYLESRNNSFDIELLSPTLSNSAKATVAISTPSPSATADGFKVDYELEKFRRLSEEWIRNRDTEEAENRVDILGSRSPSPQRVIAAASPKFYSQRNTSLLSQRPRSLSPDKTSLRRAGSQENSAEPIRSLRSRSPTPLLYSPLTKTFTRPGDNDLTNKFNFQRTESSKSDFRQSSSYGRKSFDYSNSSSSSSSDFQQTANYRRDNKVDYRERSRYDKDNFDTKQSPAYGKDKINLLSLRSPSLHKPTPLPSIFRRSHSYEGNDQILSNFRSRSTSPSRLNPASNYYHRSNSVEDRDYHSRSRSRSPSPQTSRPYQYYSLFKRSNSLEGDSDAYRQAHIARLENIFKDSYGEKYNTLPRFRYLGKANSPSRDNPFRATDSRPVDYLKTYSKSFLVNSIPELEPPKMMSAPQRRYSEEPPSVRKPLATLHEDDDIVRRRYSDSVRKSPFSDGYRRSPFSDGSRKSPFDDEDYYISRRLSEAGVRKSSDASVVLTEDTDSFIIGDRVWVGGIKPGSISYLGETQFAPGDWAGVTLDEPIGKNDGSVAGVRYFQCEPKKGVFSRLTRLSRDPLSDRDLEYLASTNPVRSSDSPKSMSTPTPSVTSSTTQRKITPVSQQLSSANSVRKTTPPINEPARKITQSSIGKNGSSTTAAATPAYRKTSASYQDLNVGDRVTVDSATGFKFGTLRHLGVTAFADGVWAGVELDEPTGKNDGSVAGKKYFTCRSKHGLFAPIARVSRFTGRALVPSRSSIPSIRRSRSRESLGASSVGSASVSSIRVPGRPSRTSAYDSPSTRALQETLTEKSQHIDQLMRERDLERNEVSRMANQLDEALRAAQSYKLQLSQNQIESEERLHDFEQKVLSLDAETKDLFAKLEDKQREIDDLNFRVEEESLAKADYQSQNTTNTERLKVLEDQFNSEKKKTQDRNDKDVDIAMEMEEIELSLHKSVEELQVKVMELEQEKDTLCKRLEEEEAKYKKLEVSNFSLSNSINEKEQKINLLEITQASEEGKIKEKDGEFAMLEKNLEFMKLELEKKSKDLEDVSQQAEEFLSDIKKEQQKRKKLEEEIVDIHEKLKVAANTETNLKLEMDKFKEESLEAKISLENNNLKLTEIAHDQGILSKKLEDSEEVNAKISVENSSLLARLQEKEEKITNLETVMLAEGETALKERDSNAIKLQQTLLSLQLEVEKKVKELELESQTNKDLRNELETVKSQKDKLNMELTEFQNQVNISSTHESELKFNVIKAEEEVMKWKSSYENCSMKISELEQEKDDISKKLEQIMEISNVFESENASLKNSVEERKSIIAALESNRLTEEENLQKMSNEILQLERNIKDLKLELENKLSDFQEVSNRAEQLESNLLKERQEKRTIDEELRELQDRVKLNIVSESHFNSEVIKLKDEIKEWKSSFENSDTKMNSMLKENGNLKKELRNSEGIIQSLNSQVEELKSNSAITIKELDQMKVLEEEKNKLVIHQKQLEDKLDRLSDVEKVNCILIDEKFKVETDLSNIRQSFEERNHILVQNQKLKDELEVLRNLELEFSNLKTESKNLENKLLKISELEVTVLKLNQDIKEAENKNDILKNEKDSILQTLEDKSVIEQENFKLKSSLQNFEVQKSNLEHENKELKLNLKNLEEAQSTSNQEYEHLKVNMQNLEEEKSNIEKVNQQLKANIMDIEEGKSNFEKENEQFQSRLQHLEEEKSCLKQANETLEQNLNKLDEKKSAIEKENEQLKLCMKNVEDGKSGFEQMNKQLKLEVNSFQEGKINLEKDIEQLKLSVKISKERKSCLEQLNEQLKIELDKYELEQCRLRTENEQFRFHIQSLEEGKSKFEILIEQLNLDVSNLEEGKLFLERQVDTLSQDIARLKMTEVDYSKCLVDLTCVRNEKEDLELCIQDLRDRVSNLSLIQQEKDNLDKIAKELVESHKDIEDRLGSQIRNLESDKITSLREMEAIQLEITQLKEGLIWGKEEIEAKEKQRAELQMKLLSSESEKRRLSEEVCQLKETLNFREAGNDNTSDFAVQLKAERDQFEGQVSFLNSVIVDMQRKKVELEGRISLLQTANVPDDEKANMSNRKEKILKAPRVFCDICDCFDLHDTEDCPTQSTSESPPHSQYHGERNASRPYCDLCEVFGHEKGECPVEDTY